MPNTQSTSQSDWHITLRLAKLMFAYPKWLALGLLLSLITIFANVGLMAVSAWFITSMALAGVQGVPMNYYTPSASIRGLAIARTTSRYAERLVTHDITFKLITHLRVWFYRHLEPLVPSHLKQWHSGDLLSRMSSDITTLENVYLRILSPITTAILASLVFTWVLFYFDSLIAWVCFSLLVIAGVGIPLLIYKPVRQHGSQIQQIKSDLRTTLIDSTQGMSDVLLYQASQAQLDKFAQQNQALQQHQQQLSRFSGFSQGGVLLCANLALWFALLLGIPLFHSQALSAPNLALIALFTLAMFEAIMAVPNAFLVLPETLAAARRIFAITDQTDTPLSDKPIITTQLANHVDIVFDKVSFAYPANSSTTKTPPINVLQNLSLSIPQGHKIAITGASGCGKSTIIQLLLQFYHCQQGKLLFNGQDSQTLDADYIRQHISVVSQHPYLFTSSIKANLYLANREASDADIKKACQIADIDDFIQTLPDQYQTWLGETGVKVSGGQAKRLAIARALLKPAPILILDEPGESLDIATEQRVIDNIINAYPKKTLILITHSGIGLQAMDTVYSLE